MKKMRMCSICRNMRMDGIKILGQWVCNECEGNLLKMDVDHPYYEYHVEQVKTMWKNHYLLQRKKELL